jgi:NAD(P)-dependent dehydrogenase (short-subunit alcohol dehydrogenase family)
VTKSHGGYDVLVQNAGVFYLTPPYLEEETMNINYWGSRMMLEKFGPITNSGGRIVNISSELSLAALYSFK